MGKGRPRTVVCRVEVRLIGEGRFGVGVGGLERPSC
jgi:hypothetical protein